MYSILDYDFILYDSGQARMTKIKEYEKTIICSYQFRYFN